MSSGFKVICNNCNEVVDINEGNVDMFRQDYAWGYWEYKIDESTTNIAVFNTFDSCTVTMICKCGNKVAEKSF